MTTTQQLRDNLAAAKVDRDRLGDELSLITRDSGNADLNPGQLERWNNLSIGLDRARARVTEAETALEERRVYADGVFSRMSTTTGDGAAAYGQAREASFRANRGGSAEADVFAARAAGGVETLEGSRLYVDAACRSIDHWTDNGRDTPSDFQESATALLRGDPRYRAAIARHVAVFSNEDYISAFRSYMMGGLPNLTAEERRTMLGAEGMAQRAMGEGSIGTGLAIVPPFLDPSIILTNTGVINPFRQIADVKTIETQVWKGVSSGGVSAEWTAEASEMADASPSDFVQPSITPIRADAFVEISYELAQDTSIVSDISMLFADSRDRLEGTAFATGTGSTQPFGLVTMLNLTTASRVSTTTSGIVGAVDFFALDSALPARYRPNAQWVASPFIWNATRQLAIGASPQNSAFWVDFGGALPSKLLGREVSESSAMIATQTTGSRVAIIADFKKAYTIVDRIGMQIAVINVIGSNRRPTGQFGYSAFWRVGASTLNPDAARVMVT